MSTTTVGGRSQVCPLPEAYRKKEGSILFSWGRIRGEGDAGLPGQEGSAFEGGISKRFYLTTIKGAAHGLNGIGSKKKKLSSLGACRKRVVKSFKRGMASTRGIGGDGGAFSHPTREVVPQTKGKFTTSSTTMRGTRKGGKTFFRRGGSLKEPENDNHTIDQEWLFCRGRERELFT